MKSSLDSKVLGETGKGLKSIGKSALSYVGKKIAPIAPYVLSGLTLFGAGALANKAYGEINPFVQPSINTSLNESYGHPDLNNNGMYDNEDLELMQAQQFSSQYNDRADVNANGIPGDTADVRLFQERLNGTRAHLPLEFNAYPDMENLTTSQFDSIMTKKRQAMQSMLDIDQTDTNTWRDGSVEDRFISGNFATQLVLNFHGYNGNDIPTKYNTDNLNRFNWPVYNVLKYDPSNSGNGHGMNAILIGDNPSNIDHWLFIEPQNDWLYHSEVFRTSNVGKKIALYKASGFQDSDMPQREWLIEFNIGENGASSISYQNPDLVLERPDYIPTLPVGETSIVGDRQNPSLLEKITLEQNYPNPFNGMTNIPYTLPNNGDIKMNVYDINGKLVQKVLDGMIEKGNHVATINLENKASGTYLIKLDGENQSTARRINLVK